MFSKRLNKLRKDCGFTAQKMADELNIGIRNYRKYESGHANPTIDGVVSISRILGVPVDYLLECGIYGKLADDPAVKPMIAESLDSLLGRNVLDKMHISSVIDLPDVSFCQLAASLIEDFSLNKNTLEIHWKI